MLFTLFGTVPAFAQEPKGPKPLTLANTQQLSIKQIHQFVKNRRDTRAHFFVAAGGNKYKFVTSFDAEYNSCLDYMYTIKELSYTRDKNFFGLLYFNVGVSGNPTKRSIGLNAKVFVICDENINKFALDSEIQKIADLILAAEMRFRKVEYFQDIIDRIDKLETEIGTNKVAIEDQSKNVGDFVQTMEKVKYRTNRLWRSHGKKRR